MEKLKNKKKLIWISLSALLLILTVLFSAGQKIGFPSWKNIFDAAGLGYEKAGFEELPFLVHFIDVGQGDCVLIEADHETMLIDSGENGNDEKIMDYLRRRNIDKLTCAVITHPHSDHMGSMDELIQEIPISSIFMKNLPGNLVPTNSGYQRFLHALRNYKGKLISPEAGAVYMLGSAKLTILSPSRDYDALNDTSIVIRLEYGEKAFLFMGDAEAQPESDIMERDGDISADVIKLGHHGSFTSSSERFLRQVSPEIAVACCGFNNEYGHPHREVKNRLAQMNIEFFRTDLNGTIVIGSDGKELTVYTEK